MVERWGEPDFSKSVLAASLVDRKFDPVGFFLASVIIFSCTKFLWGCLLLTKCCNFACHCYGFVFYN